MAKPDRPIPRGPDPLWAEIIDGKFLPAWDANQERLLLDLHRRVVDLERKTKDIEDDR